jgi:hypothetical protein
MPDYQTVIDADKFWNALEGDLCPLPVVAVALGLGRNFMCKIPVKPIIIAGRKCYRKSDILDWAETDEGKALWLELRAKNTSIGRYERGRSAAWDTLLGFSGPNESKRKDLQIRRLCSELESYSNKLRWASWPESEETAKLRELAFETFITLKSLQQKTPRHKQNKPRWLRGWKWYQSDWWVIDDPDKRGIAHKERYRVVISQMLEDYQADAAKGPSYIRGVYDMSLDEWNLHASEMIESLRADLKALD